MGEASRRSRWYNSLTQRESTAYKQANESPQLSKDLGSRYGYDDSVDNVGEAGSDYASGKVS